MFDSLTFHLPYKYPPTLPDHLTGADSEHEQRQVVMRQQGLDKLEYGGERVVRAERALEIIIRK